MTDRKALPMLQDGESVILSNSTTSICSMPAFSVYSATKAAVRSFARNAILDLENLGMRVNAISSGVTNMKCLDVLLGGCEQADGVKKGLSPRGRPCGSAGSKVSRAVLFLA